MSVRPCDHTSVGLLVPRNDSLLLIERARPPFGMAPPAGHVDDDPSYEDAARRELLEEVGLRISELELVGEGRRDNPCRRPGGTWHYWRIFRVQTAMGSVSPSPHETNQVFWAGPDQLQALAERTRAYLVGRMTDREWQEAPGLEPVWYGWLRQLSLVQGGKSAPSEEE